MNPNLDLSHIREILIRQEETIIFNLIERAQFKVNSKIYCPGAIQIPQFSGSFLDYLLLGTENLHARVRRYQSPDEHPFFSDLSEPILEPLQERSPIDKTAINLNVQIKKIYEQEIIPLICPSGDDNQYGSSAVNDVSCLQAISKRVHYGKFVAESKYLAHPEAYDSLIKKHDYAAILAELEDAPVERKLLIRVERKAAAYGQEIEGPFNEFKIQPEDIKTIYQKWLIPLTKQVETEYLLQKIKK